MKFGVTVWCFLLSYIIVMVLEYSRLFFTLRSRTLWLIGAMSIGWITHTMFLFDRLGLHANTQGLLSSWFQWALLVAWGVASIYLGLLIRRPDNAFGTFMLPLLLASIAVALSLRDAQPFERDTTINLWRTIHAISLLVGTMIIAFGMATGLMYVVQSYRLKHKIKPRQGFRLPSLEYLQSLNRMCLFISFAMLALGLLSGIVLNVNRSGHIAWFSGGIIFTFALCTWSLIAVIVETTAYRAFGGKRTAYLTIANFIFLVIVLALVMWTPHQRRESSGALETPAVSRAQEQQGARWRCIG